MVPKRPPQKQWRPLQNSNDHPQNSGDHSKTATTSPKCRGYHYFESYLFLADCSKLEKPPKKQWSLLFWSGRHCFWGGRHCFGGGRCCFGVVATVFGVVIVWAQLFFYVVCSPLIYDLKEAYIFIHHVKCTSNTSIIDCERLCGRLCG